MNNEQKSVIELKELRIGNYLLYKGDIVHVTTISLDVDDELEDTIGFCKLGQIHNEISDWNRALYNDLERIPLTDEWLEKFGFTSNGQGDDFHDKPLWKHHSTSYRYCESGFFVDNDGPYGHYCDIGDAQYLHQLQNLYFALTGQELKLKDQ